MGCKGGAGVRKSEWEVFGRALKCQQVLWQQGDASAYCAAFIWHIHHSLGPWLWSTSEWCMTITRTFQLSHCWRPCCFCEVLCCVCPSQPYSLRASPRCPSGWRHGPRLCLSVTAKNVRLGRREKHRHAQHQAIQLLECRGFKGFQACTAECTTLACSLTM